MAKDEMNKNNGKMEKLFELNRAAVIITPNQEFFNHLAEKKNIETIKAGTSDQNDESTVYLIPGDLQVEENYENYLETVYMRILEEEVDGWVTSEQEWVPEISYETFRSWFSISFQSMVFDTLSEEPEHED
jgi:hypothetical protein